MFDKQNNLIFDTGFELKTGILLNLAMAATQTKVSTYIKCFELEPGERIIGV